MVRAGDAVVQAAGHRMRFVTTAADDADEPTTFAWTVQPALRTEAMFEKIWRDAAEGREGDLLQGAVLMQAYAAEFRLVRPPRWLQVPLFAVLGTIGRLLGRRAQA